MPSIADFIATHTDQERDAGPFEVENRATLQVNLQGTVYAKAGAMIAYRGDVKFSRKGVLEDGVGRMLKKAVTGEGMTLDEAEVERPLRAHQSGEVARKGRALAQSGVAPAGQPCASQQRTLLHERGRDGQRKEPARIARIGHIGGKADGECASCGQQPGARARPGNAR